MRKLIFLSILPFISYSSLGQPNCSIYQGECRKACLFAVDAARRQGTQKSQDKFSEAIVLCPQLDYAYFEQAVPYLKRGDFITWKRLIDKAVELNPVGHLGYRAWCRFQFVRDYKGAVRDIEALITLTSDIGYSINGDYHLSTALALCYKQIGERQKAIEILEAHVSQPNYVPWAYEFLHLGVLRLEVGKPKQAVKHFLQQIEVNDYLAETYYYLALTYKNLNKFEDYIISLQKARKYYLAGKRMSDPYTAHVDKIYLKMIDEELEAARRN